MARINASRGPLVLFDVGGVLILWEDEWTFRLIARRYDLPYRRVRHGMVDERDHLQRGLISLSEFAHRVERRLGIPASPGIAPLWTGEFRRHARSNPPLLALARKLRVAGIPTGLFSNTDFSHVALFREQRWFPGFKPWVLSCEAGEGKPFEGAFRWAEHLTHRRGKDLILIDDRLPNVQAARERGWRAIHHRTPEGTRAELEVLLPRALSSGARGRTSRRRATSPSGSSRRGGGSPSPSSLRRSRSPA